jgi:hypothetical protein
MKDNYYYILGLDKDATAEEIKRAYRQLAKKYHPDKNPGKEEAFKRLSNAYKTLSDPNLKARFDASLKPVSQPNYATTKPKYTKRTTYYTSERPKYTRKMKLYGILLSIGFILLMVLFATGVMYKASDYRYNEGLQLVEEDNPLKAIRSFEEAISIFGQRSGEASIAAARIVLTKTVNPRRALHYTNIGIRNTFKQQLLAELHFLKAKALTLDQQFEYAEQELLKSETLGYSKDSVMLQLGLLNAFQFNEFEKGIVNFNYLLESHPDHELSLFGKAWCLQKLNEHHKAILIFDQLLKHDNQNALGYFYRGRSEIQLGDTISACSDFIQSYALGYTPAKPNETKYCTMD